MSFKWRLYYEDGSTFSDSEGAPHESPPWGSLFVSQPGYDPPVMGLNSDWLMWREDTQCWEECGADGLDDHVSHYGHLIGCLRKTRWIPRARFKEIWSKVRDDE